MNRVKLFKELLHAGFGETAGSLFRETAQLFLSRRQVIYRREAQQMWRLAHREFPGPHADHPATLVVFEMQQQEDDLRRCGLTFEPQPRYWRPQLGHRV